MINKKILLLLLIIICSSGCSKYIDTCDDNYELIDGECRTITERKEKSIYYFCFDFDEQVDNKCIHTSIKEPGDTSCNKGNGVLKTKCNKPSKSNTCPKDYKLSDGKCIKTEIIDANKRYYCEDGYTMVNNECVKYEYKEVIRRKY